MYENNNKNNSKCIQCINNNLKIVVTCFQFLLSISRLPNRANHTKMGYVTIFDKNFDILFAFFTFNLLKYENVHDD